MFFKKKKPEPKPEKSLAEQLTEQCDSNVKAILSKLAMKRDEMLHLVAAEGKEEEIEMHFEVMADYLTSMNWKNFVAQTLMAARFTDIDNHWTNRVDVENAKYMINMQWKIMRVDINKMIADVCALVEGDPA
jgi:hypothetical protein